MLPSNIAGLVVWLRADLDRYTTSTGDTAANTSTDPVGRWEDQTSGARHFVQATDAARPTYLSTIPSINFDGSNDVLSYAGSRTDTSGTLILAFKTGATAFATRGSQVLFSSADTGTANNWFEVGITSEGRLYIDYNASGTQHTIVGHKFLSLSTAYHLGIAFDDTDFYVHINGVEQNPLMITSVGTFGWLGDVSGADNLSVGGTVTSAGLVRPFLGDILEVALYSRDIT